MRTAAKTLEPDPVEAAVMLSRMIVAVDPTSVPVRVYRSIGKRLFDIVGSVVLLIGLGPLLIALAVLVRCRLGYPVLFLQQRMSTGGRPFEMRKFRTMRPDRRSAERSEPVALERRHPIPSQHDPRLTPLGRSLSRTSLDELPQLVNVLRGEMSLVGPRPDYPRRRDTYVADERRRFDVAPGVTGPWQVLVGTTADLHEYVELDLMYVDRYSFINDLRILLATPRAVWRRVASVGAAR